MGEAADDMRDGTCCQYCGVWNDAMFDGDPNDHWIPPGYPWTCEDCIADSRPINVNQLEEVDDDV